VNCFQKLNIFILALPTHPDMKKHPFAWFLILTFGITWGLAALFFSLQDTFERIFGEMSATNPVFVLAVWGPNIAGVVVVGVKDGR
jgi:hypothetical protein